MGTAAFHNADIVRLAWRIYGVVFKRHWKSCRKAVRSWWK